MLLVLGVAKKAQLLGPGRFQRCQPLDWDCRISVQLTTQYSHYGGKIHTLPPRAAIQDLLGAVIENLENLLGNIMACVAVHHLLNHQVVFLGFGYLLNRLVGLVQNLL